MAVLKENFFIEFRGKKINQKDFVTKAKEIWKARGKKVNELTSLDLYYNSEEGKCYFVFNGVASNETFNF